MTWSDTMADALTLDCLPPLAPDQLATVKRYAVAMIDDERVASYVLRLLDETALLKRGLAEAQDANAAMDAIALIEANERIAELEQLVNNGVWAVEFVTQVTVKRRSFIEARVFADDMVVRAREVRSYAAEAAKDKDAT